jgi:tetratricopeptide (TPR) repeat protein
MRHVRAALIAIALLLSGGSFAFADQNDPALDTLFARLRVTKSAVEAEQIQGLIWKLWMETDDDDLGRLMRQGINHMNQGRLDQALIVFGTMVSRAPNFAEGWNKKATVEYMMGDYKASMADVDRTLRLEPRHFGALAGLGLIQMELGDLKAALRAFERAIEVNPHLDGPRARIRELRRKVEGDPT